MSVVPSRQCRPAPLDALATATLVPLELIVDAPGQPRRSLPEVETLAANIESLGLLQPVALRRVDGRYEVVAGHRRVAAYRLLRARRPHAPEYQSISSIVSRLDDETAFLSMVSAQVHSIGWTPAEEACALQRLLEGGMAQCDLARLLGKSESWLSRRLTVYADSALAEPVLSGRLAPGIADELASVRHAPARRDMADRAITEGWSPAEARRHARSLEPRRTVRAIGRLTRELYEQLRGIDAAMLTGDVRNDLELLARTIERVAQHPETSAA